PPLFHLSHGRGCVNGRIRRAAGHAGHRRGSLTIRRTCDMPFSLFRGRSRRDDNASEHDLEVLMHRPDHWASLDREKLKMLTFYGCVRYGRSGGDAAEVPALLELYRTLVQRLSVPERQELLQRVNDAVGEEIGTAHAFWPFLFADPETGVVSTAALNFAVLLP